MAIEADLTLGEAARLAGVPASTLRFGLAKRPGFTLAEIRIILSGVSGKKPPSAVWKVLAPDKLPEVEQTLAEAQAIENPGSGPADASA